MSEENTTIKEKSLRGRMLGEILISLGRIKEGDLEDALYASKQSHQRLGEYLLNQNIISEDDLLRALSLQLGLEYREELIVGSEVALTTPLSKNYIKRYNVLIISENADEVELALNDPFLFDVIENVRVFTGKEVKPILAKKLDILRIADIIAGDEVKKERSIEEESIGIGSLRLMDEEGQLEESALDLANEAPVIKLVNLMITEALKERASDIHIEPSEDGVTVRYRIDGVLYNVLSPPKRYQQAIVSRIKIMANLNIAENRLPQDGRIRIKFGANDVDIRVSIVPSVVGERVVMRLLVKDEKRFSVNHLGMRDELLKEFKDLLKIPHGIIIVSGPTGSGKTTTLYAAIKEINSTEKNIITIEDPVEYRIKGISQIQVNPKIDLTFANGLRSILRQDPEVIMVGEIRDRETAEIAVQAAMTGHLVLSTVHTNDAASGIVRLLDMGIEPYLIASTVNAFLSQRLVRVLCEYCKKPIYLDKDILIHEGINPELFKERQVYKAIGCSKCQNTGYHGRIGIFEMIKVDESIRKMIVSRKDASYIRDACVRNGMKTMLDDGIEKVLEGITTIDEVLRVIRE
ncbi:MAG: type II secretion system protein GspE [Spirochaetes bacterium]|nr:MAG: type II secretion system protein GspE [Spirochaetota bacterium]